MDNTRKDLFKFSGDEKSLKIVLTDYLEAQDIDKFIAFISDYPFNNGIDYIQTEVYYQSPPPGMLSLMIAQKNYNINLTKSAFILLAAIIDIKFKMPIASIVMNMTGISTKTITKIDERKGEKCIVFEVMKSGKQNFNINKFDNKGECINNQFEHCKYRDSDLCNICKKDISEILDSLVERNVITKKMDNYKYIL